jgi:hypothetical protein
MLSEDELKEKLDGISLSECVTVLESALAKYHSTTNYWEKEDYHRYYVSIIECKQPTKNKKALLVALSKIVPVCEYRYSSQRIMSAAFNAKDVSMIKFLTTDFSKITGTPLLIKSNTTMTNMCIELGKDTSNNGFVIKYLTTVRMPLTIIKAFLYGAIIVRNMVLISFIVEQMKIDIFVPTSKRVNHSLGEAFAKNDDLELVKWFEEHEYNIHESQRALLNYAYSYNAKRIIAYVLSKQLETEGSDLYMENLATQAFHKGDIDLLTQFPIIKMHVSTYHIYNALSDKKELIYIKALVDRYVQIKKNKGDYWPKTPEGDIKCFGQANVSQMYKNSLYNESVWAFLSDMLYKHGDGRARNKLAQLGYVNPNYQPGGENDNDESADNSDIEMSDEL